MTQWGNTDDAANSALWGVSNHNKVANTGNQTAFFGNTTVGAFDNGAAEAVGQFGVDTAEMGATDGPAHAGWVERTEGVGEIESITVSDGGTNFANGDPFVVTAETGVDGFGTVVVSANVITEANLADVAPLLSFIIVDGGDDYANGDAVEVVASIGANASGNVVTTSNVITAVTIANNGGYFIDGPTINITTGAGTNGDITAVLGLAVHGLYKEGPTITVTTGAGSGETLVGVVGGRAGRVNYETLVAMGSMTGDASDDTEFPDS